MLATDIGYTLAGLTAVGIIVIGALLQIGNPSTLVLVLAGISVLIATINIAGGFWVTQRMLRMFRKD